MSHLEMLTIALCLDAVFGEPRWLWSRCPHPAVLTGRGIARAEGVLNRGDGRRAKGVLLVAGLVALAGIAGAALAQAGGGAETIGAAVLLAQRSLMEHVRAVARDLRQSLVAGRRAVARIVSRDTRDMDAARVSRAAIETAAENFSDAVVAPAFWFLVAGLPGILIYKAVNTADSMIGYRTARHAQFGWAAARLDDLLNLIPARLTALLIALCHGVFSQWPRIRADARRHKSPNAGWPEAALSRALGIALAGPRAYDGRMQDFAWVNASGRKDPGSADIDAACRALWICWAAGLAGLVLLSLAIP